MKSKLLILALLAFGGFLSLKAQVEPYRNLVYSELRMDHTFNAYVQLTNMGTETINLKNFRQTSVTGSQSGLTTSVSRRLRLHDHELAPGESYVIAAYYDFGEIIAQEKPHLYDPISKPEMKQLANQLVFPPEHENYPMELPDPRDSISTASFSLWTWSGQSGGWYLEWLSEDGLDSAVIDVANIIWDGNTPTVNRNVAGVTDATLNSILIRKANVTQGNEDWDNSRGIDLEDSEWLPVPKSSPSTLEFDRDPFWTIGNHGNYRLTAETLVSTDPEILVDFAAKTISVPWGIRNNDSIMRKMERKPGVTWQYNFSPNREDSAYSSIRNGDAITIYVAGNQLDMARFDFVVRPPKNTDNIVVPKNNMNFNTNTYVGVRGNFCAVSDGVPGMDTISAKVHAPMGLPYATRIDSLLKYLEKPTAASWEVVLKDGETRADLKDGDILKVTAQNGNVKEYYIKVAPYLGSSNANLSAITWPDIPEFYKGLFDWKGDTIPNFSPNTYIYQITVPFDVDGIPAFVFTPANQTTTIEVERAKNLFGSQNDRTITINTTAGNGIDTRTYRILLSKEANPADMQPWAGEPFIGGYGHDEQGSYSSWNHALKLVNPGTELIDLSNYFLIQGDGSPADVISSAGLGWDSRYMRYIPGYMWADSITWDMNPGMFVPDLNVDPIVYGGEAWAIASAGATSPPEEYGDYHIHESTFNVNFKNKDNPWAVPYSNRYNTVVSTGRGNTIWLFRIDNDSIKAGLKSSTDPADFTLLDVFGNADGSRRTHINEWNTGPVDHHQRNWQRKPHIYQGNPVPGASFNSEDWRLCEWTSMRVTEWQSMYGMGLGEARRMTLAFMGTHDMDEVTIHQSVIASNAYKITSGYGMNEDLWGVVTGTNVNNFLANIIKKHEGQVLTVMNAGGTVKEGTTYISDGDFLVVISADETNTTRYKLGVSAGGLSPNALLTSATYTILVENDLGRISGFDYNTLVQNVLDNVVVPDGATLTMVDNQDKYLPLKKLNNDTVYVDIKANPSVFFEVVAENGVNKILYQLVPTTSSTDAFVLSDLYIIDQEQTLIDLVNSGVSVQNFLDNLIPAFGATIELVDKYGFPRVDGTVKLDDLLVVTAEDGVTKKIYFLNYLGFVNNKAYVLSNVYDVNQFAKTIADPSLTTQVSPAAFAGNLTVSEGASMMVVHANGSENTTGKLAVGDMVKVTAPDGITVFYYEVLVEWVGIENAQGRSLSIYPNPTTGSAVLSGVEIGNRVFVYNSLGVINQIITVESDKQVISLENEPSGLYFIIVESSGKTLDRFTLMKR